MRKKRTHRPWWLPGSEHIEGKLPERELEYQNPKEALEAMKQSGDNEKRKKRKW